MLMRQGARNTLPTPTGSALAMVGNEESTQTIAESISAAQASPAASVLDALEVAIDVLVRAKQSRRHKGVSAKP
jgi:hypothetical protein